MKHAVIVTGGKQYRVAEGDVVFVEKLAANAGDTVTFDQVLCVVDDENTVIGTPVVEGASVTANVLKTGKAAKIRVYKMKPKRDIAERRVIVSPTQSFRSKRSMLNFTTDFE